MHERSATLDLLRIFAALSVMGFHLGTGMWIPKSGTGADTLSTAGMPVLPADATFWWGWIGVPIFYALSGYLIAGALHRDAVPFVLARLSRLVPGAIASATLTTVLLLTLFPPATEMAIRFALSISLWPFGPWVDSVYWTLGMEMGFYALVAVLLWRRSANSLEAIMIAIAAVSTLAWCASAMSGVYAPQVPGVPDRITHLVLLKDGAFFATGVILRAASKNGWTARRSIALVLTALAACLPILAEAEVRAHQGGLAVAPMLACAIWLTAVGLIAAPWRARSSPWLSLLSRATYPLYLVHSAGGAVVVVHLHRIGWERLPATIAAACAAVLAALSITAWVEPWVRESIFGRRRLAVQE